MISINPIRTGGGVFSDSFEVLEVMKVKTLEKVGTFPKISNVKKVKVRNFQN